VPIYEYRCPKGHTFEVFKRMDDPAPEQCEVCGAAPLEIVLYPVAVHYKGSGFYSTDYGKGGKKKPVTADSSSSSGSSDSSSSSSDSGGSTEKKSDAPAAPAEPKKAAEG
jgi:putative FmdB family regulatory protein